MQKNLTTGSVFKNIVIFSLPFLLSYFLQTLYGLADLFIVGQYNGADIISAVSIGSQVMHMLTVIIVGLAMGSTVLIGQAVGGGELKTASKTIGNTITLFMAVSVIFTIALMLFTDRIVHIMSTPPEAIAETRRYLLICFAGIPFITAYNIISSVFRGLGDSKSPMYFIAVACVLNIILDYLFIGYFGMGASGAALGTVISQTASVVFALITIRRRESGIAISKSDLVPDKSILSDLLRIGIPVSLQDGFIQISFIIITIIANRRGVSVAAAVGIVEKIICLVFLVPSSMLSSISALAAQNIGAKKHDRAALTLKYGVIITIVFGAIVSLICQFVPTELIAMFSNDAAVIAFGAQYLSAYIFDCIFAGIHFSFSGYFCAYGLSYISFIHNIAAILLVRIPGTYLAALYFPDTLLPMGMAAPGGSLLSALICIGVYLIMRKKFRSQE